MNHKQINIQNIIKFLKHMNTLNLSSAEEEQILSCLLTPKEILAIEHRLHIIIELKAGKAQRKIAEQLKTGIASITRGSRVLQENGELINKLFNEHLKL